MCVVGSSPTYHIISYHIISYHIVVKQAWSRYYKESISRLAEGRPRIEAQSVFTPARTGFIHPVVRFTS